MGATGFSLSYFVSLGEREKRMTAAAPCSGHGTTGVLAEQENGYSHGEVGL